MAANIITPKRYRIQSGALKSFDLHEKNAGVTVGDGWVEGWVSPETVDRSGDYVPVDEWNLDLHRKNPVAFSNHDVKGPIIGKWEHPNGEYAIEKRKGGLWGRCYFDLETEDGRKEYQQYKKGFKRGFSPRFYSRSERGRINNRPANILRNAILTEVSCVGMPDNPEALAVYVKSFRDFTGNTEATIPAGHVLRFGVYPMPEATAPNGLNAYFGKLASGFIETCKAAKEVLNGLPQGESRNVAYGLLAPFYRGVLEAEEAAKTLAPEFVWTEHKKMIGEVLEGFDEFVKTAAPATTPAESQVPILDQAELEKIIGSIVESKVDAKIAPTNERLNEIQVAVASHESAIGTILDTHEALAN